MINLAVIILIVICTPNVAAAGPIGAAIAAFNAFAASSVIAGVVAKVAVYAGLSALGAALRKKPKQRQSGIKTEVTTTGGANPQTFILGLYATAGNRAAPPYSGPNSADVPNEYLTFVFDVSDVPVSGLSRIAVNGEWVTDARASAGAHQKEALIFQKEGGEWVPADPEYLLQYSFYQGRQTAADPYLLAQHGADPDRPWQIDMVGEGVAYAVMTFKYNRETFNGMPSVLFEVIGIPLYDPRLDTSVGGTGAQRWADPATWAFSQNPALMIYNILRGIALPDGSIWGGRVAAADLPLANWFAAMNECDVQVSRADGVQVAQYVAGLEVSIDTPPADVIDNLTNACAGEVVEVGGVYTMRVGPVAMPVFFFTDADLSVDDPRSLLPHNALDVTHNALHVTHPSPEAMWAPHDAPPRFNAAWEAEDGRRLVATLDLPAVARDEQVQRLMSLWLKDERRARRHNVTLPPEAAALDPLDAVAWTSARNGYTSKVFEIGDIADDFTTLQQTVSLRERDANDVSWIPGQDEVPVSHPVNKAVILPARVLPGWRVEGATLADDNGASRRVGLRFFWDGALTGDARGIAVQIRYFGTTGLATSVTISNVERGEAAFFEGILPDRHYEARALMLSGRKVQWTAWDDANTSAVYLSAADLAAEILADIDAAADAATAAQASANEAILDANAVAGDLSQLIGTFVGDLPALDAADSALGVEIDGVRSDLTAAQSSLTTSIDGVRSDLTIAEGEIDGVRSDLTAAQSSLTTSIDGVRSDLTIAEGEIDGVRSDLTAAQSSLTTSIDGVRGDLTIAEGEIDGVRSDLTAAQSDLGLLTDRVSSAETGLTDEQTARTNADSSLTNNLNAAVARIGDSEAAIASEQATRADADSAIAGDVSALTTRMGTAESDITSEQTARADADSAIAGDVSALTTRMGTAESDITSEQTARANADSAIASDVSALTTRMGTAESDITSEQTARANGDSAIASDVSALTTRMGTAESDITSEQTARANGDSAIASDVSALTTRMGTAESDITSEQTARANADSAIASDVSALTTRMGTAESDITSEQTARADADSAIASDVSALTTRMGTAESDITSEQTARANGDSAIASDVSALTTRMGTAESDITSEQTARANGDSAIASDVSALTTRMGTAESDITSEQTARANGDSAIASDVSALTTRMGTAESDITSEQTARANADSAIASDVSALTTRMGTAESDITSEQTARANGDSAIASDVTALQTAVSDADDNAIAMSDDPELDRGPETLTNNHAPTAVNAPMTVTAGLRDFVASTDPEVGGQDFVATSDQRFRTRRRYAVDRNRRYKITFRVNLNAAAVAKSLYLGVTAYTADGNEAPWSGGNPNQYLVFGGSAGSIPADTWVTKSAEFDGSQIRSDGAFIRPLVLANYAGTDVSAVTRISLVRLEDITEVNVVSAALTQESAARANGDSAIASDVSALTTRMGTAESDITSEQTARANGDSAIASDVSALTTRMGTAESDITSEQTARANGDSAIASDVSALTTRMGTAESDITSEQTARANGDSAIASDVSALTTRMGTAESDITSEQTARANGDSAIASDVSALTTRMGTAESDITSEQTARANGDSAIASDVSALTTRMGTAESDITSEQTARANGDSAIASDVSALTTRMGTAESDITSEQTARANGDSAIASDVSALTTRMGTAESDITSEQTARANADSAIASDVSALTGDLGTQTARINDIRALKVSALGGTALATFLTQLQVNSAGNSGLVSAQGSAIANLEGEVDAMYTLNVQSGSSGARLDLIAPGGGASVAQLDADYIYLKGKVAADSLLVGLGGNMLPNSDFSQGGRNLQNYGQGGLNAGLVTNARIRSMGLNYTGINYNTGQIASFTTATDGYVDLRFPNARNDGALSSQHMPVTPNEWYDWSAQIATLRCEIALYVYWYDINGTYVAASGANHGETPGDAANPDRWTRRRALVQAPSNAAYGFPAVRMQNGIGTGDKYLFVHRPMFAQTHQFATESPVYSKGAPTIIDEDGIYTDAITTRHVKAGTVTAASAILANAAVRSAAIGDLEVGTLKIAGSAVTDVVVAQTKTTVEMFVNSGWNVMRTAAINRYGGAPNVITMQFTVSAATSQTGYAKKTAGLRILRGGTVVDYFTITLVGIPTAVGSNAYTYAEQTFTFTTVETDVTGGTATYQAQMDPHTMSLYITQQTMLVEQAKK